MTVSAVLFSRSSDVSTTLVHSDISNYVMDLYIMALTGTLLVTVHGTNVLLIQSHSSGQSLNSPGDKFATKMHDFKTNKPSHHPHQQVDLWLLLNISILSKCQHWHCEEAGMQFAWINDRFPNVSWFDDFRWFRHGNGWNRTPAEQLSVLRKWKSCLRTAARRYWSL